MGLDSAGYIFSDLLNFIFRINIRADIEEYRFVYTLGWMGLFAQLLYFLDILAWGLKLFTFQQTVMY